MKTDVGICRRMGNLQIPRQLKLRAVSRVKDKRLSDSSNLPFFGRGKRKIVHRQRSENIAPESRVLKKKGMTRSAVDSSYPPNRSGRQG